MEGEATWKEYAKVYASFAPLRGAEFFAATQANNIVTNKIIIRYRSDIDDTMRVRDRDITYNIVAVMPDNRNTYLVLMCKTRTYEQDQG